MTLYNQSSCAHIICQTLAIKEKCFRLRKRNNSGGFDELFHQHIPAYRISNESALSFLKSLVLLHSSLDDLSVLKTYLNGRGTSPKKINLSESTTHSPEPGVIRHCRNNHQINAWYDEVNHKEKFRVESYLVEQ